MGGPGSQPDPTFDCSWKIPAGFLELFSSGSGPRTSWEQAGSSPFPSDLDKPCPPGPLPQLCSGEEWWTQVHPQGRSSGPLRGQGWGSSEKKGNETATRVLVGGRGPC